MLGHIGTRIAAGTLLACVALSGCGSSAADAGKEKAASTKKDALVEATEACNGALNLHPTGHAPADWNAHNAEVAAKASAKDQHWNNLATAISDLANADKTLADIASRGAQDTNSISVDEMQRNLTDLLAAKKDVIAECRKVQGAGGKVDQQLLDTFIT